MTIKPLMFLMLVPLIVALTSCDMRSGTAKEEMEKWETKPTPGITLSPTPTPIDAADIVQVDTTLEGDLISANGHAQKTTKTCSKFNRLIVNGDESTLTIKGVCRQIMINGDKNKIMADAAMEFVINGSDNVVKYSRFPNGKKPSVVDNRDGNVVEKVAPEAMATNQPRNRIIK